MSKKKDNYYPFVSPQLAFLAAKYGFDEKCFGVYEKGYKNSNGKKVKAKLFRTDINESIRTLIELLKDSRYYSEYVKRPGLFEGGGSVPVWCVKAPTYHQLTDWLYDKFKIFFEIKRSEKCIYPDDGGITWIDSFTWKSYDHASSCYKISDMIFDTPQQALKDVISFNLKYMIEGAFYGPFSKELEKIVRRRDKRKSKNDKE